jgi:spermidine/putrescine transport system ATP-binding protein
VEGRDGDYVTVRLAEGSKVRAPRAVAEGHDTISIGVRPEKFRLREPSEGAPAGHNQLSGVVRDASYLGVSTQYQIDARGGARLTVYEQNVERATRAELWTPGEEVLMTWSPDHCFVVLDSAPGVPVNAETPVDATEVPTPT